MVLKCTEYAYKNWIFNDIFTAREEPSGKCKVKLESGIIKMLCQSFTVCNNDKAKKSYFFLELAYVCLL